MPPTITSPAAGRAARLATLPLLALALVLTSCEDDNFADSDVVEPEDELDENIDGGDEVPAEGEASVVMADTSFRPETVTVPAGGTVQWTNSDEVVHTVTAGTEDDIGDLFDEVIEPGHGFNHTFDAPGTYQYFCTIHTFMTAEVVVTG